jgi:hypothetical protein
MIPKPAVLGQGTDAPLEGRGPMCRIEYAFQRFQLGSPWIVKPWA